jgi:wyosine [tRNA(Phe)-imidazoG37] synthetase (radical SAM superfamily)
MKHMSGRSPQEGENIVTKGSPSVYSLHSRTFSDHRYVYPVVSRRSGGVSLGINLNPDKICNFDCVYCQVDRTVPSPVIDLSPDEKEEMITRIASELRHLIRLYREGTLFDQPPLAQAPSHHRQLRDIALSGDGEPSTFPWIDEVIEAVIRVKSEEGLEGLPIVLITNGSGLDRAVTRRALKRMEGSNGVIWAKLDAGTEDYYRSVCRTGVPFDRILRNILETAKERPVIIQSCFMRIEGEGPSRREIDAYAGRLDDILREGGSVRLVQIYTIARHPAESFVTALTDAELEIIADIVRNKTGLTVEIYPAKPA